MRILRKHKADLITYSDGKFDEDGKWVPGSEELVPIRCAIQPDLEGTVKKFLPKGVHEKDCLVIYTETLLKGSSESKRTESDSLVIDNQRYEVLEVQRWNGAGRINAWMVVCVREDRL